MGFLGAPFPQKVERLLPEEESEFAGHGKRSERMKLEVAKRDGTSHNGRVMARYILYLGLMVSLVGGVAFASPMLGGGIDLSLFEPENANVATWDGATLRNDDETDSRYFGLINSEEPGQILKITAEVVLNPSNVVAIAFGDEFSDALRLECREGVWELRCRGQRHNFTNAIPPLQSGTNTYRMTFVASQWGGEYSPTVKISANGVNVTGANHLAPPKPAWDGAMGDPSRITHARLRLGGRGSGIKRLEYSWSNPGTLIILR